MRGKKNPGSASLTQQEAQTIRERIVNPLYLDHAIDSLVEDLVSGRKHVWSGFAESRPSGFNKLPEKKSRRQAFAGDLPAHITLEQYDTRQLMSFIGVKEA